MRRALAVTLLLLLPRAASAQETPRFGLVFTFPAAVGVAIKASDRIIVRPDFGVTKTSLESTTTITVPILFPSAAAPIATTRTTTSDAWSASVGLSALVYLARPEAFRTYVTPRFAYSRASNSAPLASIAFDSSGSVTTTSTTSTTSSSSYEWSGSFGAQYALGRRFVVFGEAGPRYRRTSSNPLVSPASRIDSKSSSIGIQSGVGVIVYVGS